MDLMDDQSSPTMGISAARGLHDDLREDEEDADREEAEPDQKEH